MPKAALIQMTCGEDLAGNVARATELVAEAAALGARLVCLQEMFFCRFFAQSVDRKYYALAEPCAEFVFVPTATSTRGLSPMAWEIELRAHAIANGYFVGGVNRVGREGDMEYYGPSAPPRSRSPAMSSTLANPAVTMSADATP